MFFSFSHYLRLVVNINLWIFYGGAGRRAAAMKHTFFVWTSAKKRLFFIENLNFLYFNGDEHASQIFDDGNTLDAKDPLTMSFLSFCIFRPHRNKRAPPLSLTHTLFQRCNYTRPWALLGPGFSGDTHTGQRTGLFVFDNVTWLNVHFASILRSTVSMKVPSNGIGLSYGWGQSVWFRREEITFDINYWVFSPHCVRVWCSAVPVALPLSFVATTWSDQKWLPKRQKKKPAPDGNTLTHRHSRQ